MNVLASPRALLSSRPILLISLTTLLCVTCANVFAQAGNLNYINDMPSVERVKAEIKGSDPTDTLARQVAVFTYLSQYIQRIKYNRTVRGPYTPDEARLMAAYDLAAYQITQDYNKTHTADEAKAFDQKQFQYVMNREFRTEWTKRLMGPQSTGAYQGAQNELVARQQAHVAAEQRAYEQAQAQTTNAQGLSNDPTAVTTRRCLELGGSSIACMGKGFGTGFMSMLGFNPGDLTGPGRAGVVLFGHYRNPATSASLDFGSNAVSIVDCGKLVADGHAYTIEKRPGSLRIVVQNEPAPFTLTLRPDGGLAGPGPVDVKGRIIIGYHTITHTLYVNGAPAVGPEYGCTGVCSTSESVPDYAAKIDRCTIGSLAAPPRPKPASPQAAGADSGLMGMLVGVFNTGEMTIPTEPGLRMTGQFGGGSLLLDFSPTTVILDCGQAHVRQSYTVENTPDRLLVHIENPGGPLTLAVEPDNTLSGTGSTTVNGRLVSGMQGDNVTFSPHSETCEVGTLRPKSGSSPTTSTTKVASNTPAPAPATTAGPAPAAYAATPAVSTSPAAVSAGPAAAAPASPAPAGTRAAMRVFITTAFPSGSNPMIGQHVYVTRERMDVIIRKLGVQLPANATPGQAIQTLSDKCKSMDCRSIASGIVASYVTATTLDSAGKATLSAQAATGPYFFYAVARLPNGTGYVWDVPANLQPGDNTVTLTTSNAELIH